MLGRCYTCTCFKVKSLPTTSLNTEKKHSTSSVVQALGCSTGNPWLLTNSWHQFPVQMSAVITTSVSCVNTHTNEVLLYDEIHTLHVCQLQWWIEGGMMQGEGDGGRDKTQRYLTIMKALVEGEKRRYRVLCTCSVPYKLVYTPVRQRNRSIQHDNSYLVNLQHACATASHTCVLSMHLGNTYNKLGNFDVIGIYCTAPSKIKLIYV